VTSTGRGALVALITMSVARAAFAQPAREPRYELSIGGQWLGRVAVGSADANETTSGGGVRPLFTSTTTIDNAIGVRAAIGVVLAGAVRAEAGLVYAPSTLSTRVSDDMEQIASTTVDSPLRQLRVEGGVLVPFLRPRSASLRPFATVGVGYVRQMHDGRTLIETGQEVYAGGGLQYLRVSRRPHLFKAVGLRADVRAIALRDGVAFDDTAHVAPALTASLFVGF
jgi:hypothetical protein